MSRRAAYLLAWGVAYSFLGLFFVGSGYSPFWGWAFGLAGVTSVFSSILRRDSLDTLAFTLLSLTAAANSAWHLSNLLKEFEGQELFTFIIWGSVAIAQFVASGFDDLPKVTVVSDEEKSSELG